MTRGIKMSERILVGPELNPKIKRGEQPKPKRISIREHLMPAWQMLLKTSVSDESGELALRDHCLLRLLTPISDVVMRRSPRSLTSV